MTSTQIEKLTNSQLRALSEKLTGRPTSSRNNKALRRQITEAMAKARPKRKAPAVVGRRVSLPPVGTVLTHDYKDGRKTSTATVTEAGVEYKGKTHPSLGAAALAASGLPWNGRFFWKLDGKPLTPYPKHAPKS